MTLPAIRIENLGKRYLVDHEARSSRGGYRTLRESLSDMVAAPFKRLRGHKSATREEFWALKDVSFEVQPGEVVGIIGRNGAGKSTLLKILSQITKPTKGRVELNGRVGSLLEVGTGFHPELTGRENIYLNGSILGMRRSEIDRKFDEIVDFAEMEKFLDTPVKRYSSGMYVRLAFAVAAHLEPEVLIIDEVLAVGDHAFQEKCLGRMKDITRTGRTILFVSHNLQMLARLCTNAVCLTSGGVSDQGPAAQVIRKFSAEISAAGKGAIINLGGRRNGTNYQLPVLQKVTISNAHGSSNRIEAGSSMTLAVSIANLRRGSDTNICFEFTDSYGTRIASCHSLLHSTLTLQGRHDITCTCHIDEVLWAPGDYFVTVGIGDLDDYYDRVENALALTVEPSDIYGTGHLPNSKGGYIVVKQLWNVASDSSTP